MKRQAVSLPVGSGKTVIFTTMIPLVPNPMPGASKTLVLAHRTELLEQAARRLRHSHPQLRVATEQGAETAVPLLPQADVVVASVPTLGRSGSQRLKAYNPRDFKCIIIDEAHHASASSYLRILQHFGALEDSSHLLVWGCSATLRRHDGVGLGTVFKELSYQRSMLDMWSEGWLCRPVALQVKSDVDLSRVPRSGGDFVAAELAKAANLATRNAMIVRSWQDHVHPQQRRSTLVFCINVDHTQAVVEAFQAKGIDARAVTGSTTAEERAYILEEFRKQSFPVLVNCAVFTEGTDIPCIDCIIFARPTQSEGLFQQMLGRGLRLFPGKKDCLVIDVVDNVGRLSVVTLPTLMGLPPDFNFEGEIVCRVCLYCVL